MTDRLREALAEALHEQQFNHAPGDPSYPGECKGISPVDRMRAAAILARPAVQAALRPLLDVVEAAQRWREPWTASGDAVLDLEAAVDRLPDGEVKETAMLDTPTTEALLEALDSIAAGGCEAARWAGEETEQPVYDKCLDLDYVEWNGVPWTDDSVPADLRRCHPCIAYATLDRHLQGGDAP